MPPVTADALCAAVEGATERDCTMDGRELRTSTTDWQAAAEALERVLLDPVHPDDVESATDSGTSLVDDCGTYETDWQWAAACFYDRHEQRQDELDALDPTRRMNMNCGAEE